MKATLALNGFEFDRQFWPGFAKASPGSPALPGVQPLEKNQPLEFLLAGVDEAGRGPLAGPVVAAAVILPPDCDLEGLRDSKVVPLEQREALYCEIMEQALATAVAVIPAETIDSINILAAALLAMRQAVADLGLAPHVVLVDGNQKPKTNFPEHAIVKGDAKSASIMAASIIAKVTRDQIMIDLHKEYPHYGFNSHKGYGCETHINALRRHGPSPIHRISFEPLKSMLSARHWSLA